MMEGERAQTRLAVFEDQPLMRQAISVVLVEAGFAVVGQYADVSELVTRALADKPEVAIVGLNLHEASETLLPDGVALIREMRQRFPDVKLLVFSGPADAETVDRCYREGAFGFIDKRAADAGDLVTAVRAVSRGERIMPLNLLRSPFAPSRREPEPVILQSISIREREVLSYLAAGADNLKIAAMLHISERTVKAHVSSLYKKLGSENRTQLALAALQLGVRPPVEV
jgi:DNA-binding NarL/FixJ family response regulator